MSGIAHKSWSFYDPATGLLTSRKFSGPENMLALNTPTGHAAVEGHYDHLSKRVQDGKVVEYQPPQPSGDHEWNKDSLRWELSAGARTRRNAHITAMAQIAILEEASLRPLREIALGIDADAARKRLEEINVQIVNLRKDIIT
jgi:hypothetical protein